MKSLSLQLFCRSKIILKQNVNWEQKGGELRRNGRKEGEAVVWKRRPCGWEGVMLESPRLGLDRKA